MKKNGIDTGKKLYLVGGLVLFVLYSLNCFVILPVSNMLASDILYASNLIITNLLSLISELTELVAISVFYAAILLTVYRCGAKKGARALAIFAAATAYKYVANMAVSWAYDGSIPASWAWDIVDVIFFTALEMLQTVIVFVLIKSVIVGYTEKRDMRLRAAEKSGCEVDTVPDDVYPINCLYKKSNCLLRSAFICATVTVIAKGIGAVVSDVWLIAMYGLPEDANTWLLMAINYISKVILGFVVYFVTVLAMNMLNDKK